MPPRPSRWRGPCPNCGGLWSIVTRHVSTEEVPNGQYVEPEDGELVPINAVSEDVEEDPKIEIGGKLKAIDYVFGGGIVPGSMTLLSGPAGIGKSTLTMQILQQLAKKHRCAYVTGEESIKQVALRAKRLGKFNSKLHVVREINLDSIIDMLEDARPRIAVIDSAQMLVCISPTTDEELEPDTPMAIKVACRTLYAFAQKNEIAIILIGHVTKDGSIAGPNSFKHLVDAVHYFDGHPLATERTLSCQGKNRFGQVGPHVYAKFEMTDKGLVVSEVGSRELLAQRAAQAVRHKNPPKEAEE